jgi:hypothetical protein
MLGVRGVGDSGGMRSAANMNITKSTTRNPIPHQMQMRFSVNCAEVLLALRSDAAPSAVSGQRCGRQ